jgi:hypothetical protein
VTALEDKAAYREGVRSLTHPLNEGYAQTDTNVFQLPRPRIFAEPLTEVLRNGARALLAQAVENWRASCNPSNAIGRNCNK